MKGERFGAGIMGGSGKRPKNGEERERERRAKGCVVSSPDAVTTLGSWSDISGMAETRGRTGTHDVIRTGWWTDRGNGREM